MGAWTYQPNNKYLKCQKPSLSGKKKIPGVLKGADLITTNGGTTNKEISFEYFLGGYQKYMNEVYHGFCCNGPDQL